MKKAKLITAALVITVDAALTIALAGDAGREKLQADATITTSPGTVTFSGKLEPLGFAR